MQKIWIIGFSLKICYIGNLKWKKKSTNGCFRLHTYWCTNKALIHNSLNVFGIRRKKFTSQNVVQLRLENVYPKGQADPVNQHPDKWSSNVHSVEQKSIGLKFYKSRTGNDVRYSCHHNSSRFTFPIFAHSWRFSVFSTLQSITPRIY